MFKVVETVEKNGKQCTVVPEAWEKKNVLYWPSHMKSWDIEKERKMAESIPKTDWLKMPCKFKAMASTFAESVELEKRFASFTDTESEERFHHETPRNGCPSNSPQATNYNVLFDQIAGAELENVEGAINNFVLEETPVELTVFLEGIRADLTEIKKSVADIKVKQADFDIALTQLHIKVDKVLSDQICSNPSRNKITIILTRDFSFPLTDMSEICSLEQQLSKEDFRDEMMARLVVICGSTKVENGGKVIYKLTDFMFSPELLNKFSWTGISKVQNETKTCFQKLVNIVELIFDLILQADCRHYRQKNDEYLRDKILKHSLQWLHRKRKSSNKVTILANDEIQH